MGIYSCFNEKKVKMIKVTIFSKMTE